MDLLKKRFKRIKRKLVNPKSRQLISSATDNGTAFEPALRFHSVHGRYIRLNSDRSAACRCESFCNGVVFGDRPVKFNEPICIRFAELSGTWSGTLRFGLTTIDPQSHRHQGLPKYACPDLTSRPGHWAKGLPERYARHDTVLSYWLTQSGDIRYAINGQDKGFFIRALPTAPGLRYWPMLDIYGNVQCVELMDPSELSHQPNNNYLSVSCSNLSNCKQQLKCKLLEEEELEPIYPSLSKGEKKVLNTELYSVFDLNPLKFNCGKIQNQNNIGFNDYHHLQPVQSTMKSRARWVSSYELSLAELSLDHRRPPIEDRANEYIIEPMVRSGRPLPAVPAAPVLSKPLNFNIINC